MRKKEIEKLLEVITIKIPLLSVGDIDKIKQQGGIDARSVYSVDFNYETMTATVVLKKKIAFSEKKRYNNSIK